MAAQRPTVVLLPGLLCTAELFAKQLPSLAAAAAEVIVVPTGAGRTMGELADEVLHKVRAPRFSVAGLSMGGYIALEMCTRAPQRIERLALLSSQARADTPRHRTRRQELIALAKREGNLRAVAELQAPLLLAPTHLAPSTLGDPASPLATVHRMASTFSVEAFENQQLAIAGRADHREVLSALACPLLLAGGRDDALIPIPVLHEMANLARSSPQMQPDGANPLLEVVIEGAGHLITLEAPERTTRALLDWLRAQPQ
jgi:pimeloyl-ACP methyl ester carboxylesterase